MVQETRLVPSNVRIYFHSGSSIGSNIKSIFSMFELDKNDKALAFREISLKWNAYLTLFVRSLKVNMDKTSVE